MVLNEVIKLEVVQNTFADYYSPILCTIMLRVGSAFGVDPGPSIEYALPLLFSSTINHASIFLRGLGCVVLQ